MALEHVSSMLGFGYRATTRLKQLVTYQNILILTMFACISPSKEILWIICFPSSYFLKDPHWLQEIRNSNCAKIMAALTQSRTFSSSAHSHLAVGHTHEDVDAVLSVVKRAMDAEMVLHTPRDVMRCIDKKLKPLYEEQGMAFQTEWVDTDPYLN